MTRSDTAAQAAPAPRPAAAPLSEAEALALAAEAAAAWGGAGAAPRLLGARENIVVEAWLPQGRAALRLHRPGYQSAAAIRSELWWMAALAEAGLPVPRPIPRPRGALLARLPGGRLASAVAWVEGAPIGAAGRPLSGTPAAQAALHRRLGRLLAELHAATDRLALPPWFRRPRWDRAAFVGRAPRWGRFWAHPELGPAERRLLLAARAHAGRLLDEHAAEGGRPGLIHADVLRENVLADAEGRLSLIDFDDAGVGPRPYDLGTALSQSLEEPALEEIAAALAEGYAEGAPISAADRARLPAFTLLRCLASAGWTIGRLPPGHPGHRRYIERALRTAEGVLSGRLRFG